MNYNQINQFCLIKNDNNILFVDSGQCILIVPIFISRVEVHWFPHISNMTIAPFLLVFFAEYARALGVGNCTDQAWCGFGRAAATTAIVVFMC